MKKQILLTSLIMIILMLGCSKEEGPASPSNNDNFIMPLAVGNWWQYDDGRANITGTTVFNNITFYEFDIGWYPMGYDNNYLVALNDGNIIKQLPASPQVGDSWIGKDPDNLLRVVAEVTITVPAGTFQCFEVKLDNYSESWYYALNVGFVKGDGVNLQSYSVAE